jgi:hypothetical protein
MSVTNPRTKLVNFRLSEVEFQSLRAASTQFGARSLSDFARSTVLKSYAGDTDADGLLHIRLSDLDHKVSAIETNMQQIKEFLATAAAA